MVMFAKIVCQMFSGLCQLTSLELDISIRNSYYDIDQYLKSHTISNELQSYCITLRRLNIRLEYRCFLEYIIERVPNLEQLSVLFQYSLWSYNGFNSNIQQTIPSNENWFNKVRQM
jgi:hypothetical protein